MDYLRFCLLVAVDLADKETRALIPAVAVALVAITKQQSI
jgi:hypothetical protein